MKKTPNVKAAKLQVDDHLKIAGKMFRITTLTRHYGRGHVNISLRSIDETRSSSMHLSGVLAKDRFTIYNQ